MTFRREVEYCNVGHHVAGDVHAKQLRDRLADVYRLEAECAALRASYGVRIPALDYANQELLIHLADALRTAELFGHPAPGAQVSDHTKTGRQKPKSAAPSGGDQKARSAHTQLVRKVEAALDVFEGRQNNDWESPRLDLREVTKACEHCGQGFVAMRSTARFCSDVCRTQAGRGLANTRRTT